MKVTYREPHDQSIMMTFTLTKLAPQATVFHDSGPGCLVVRTGTGNKAIGVEYEAIVNVLRNVLPHSPAMCADLRAMLDQIAADDPDSTQKVSCVLCGREVGPADRVVGQASGAAGIILHDDESAHRACLDHARQEQRWQPAPT